MKKHILALAAAAATLSSAAQVSPDAVLLNVDGRDVTVGEFEYLFNKNNTQQSTPQSIDDYLRMFIDYKLKVADAEAEGIDRTPAFLDEFNKFRADLSAPYLRDASVEEALVQESYDHMRYDVLVSHIMFPLDGNFRQVADSIRAAILAGDITFEDAARQNSIDRGSKDRGGLMGYVIPDRYPWEFEKASYDTPVGQISEVINSGVGYHIVRPEKRTPAQGEVNASHILLLTRGLSDEDAAKQKVRIDSIYNAIEAGADFADLATRLSQDPGSARQGGSLGWFGRGAMVAEFDSVSFALADGEISKPFTTSFGYHIVKRNGHRGIEPLDDNVRKKILSKMQGDSRGTQPAEATLSRLLDTYHAALDRKGLDKVREAIAANGGYDSTAIAALGAMDTQLASFDFGTVTVAEVVPMVPQTLSTDVDNAVDMIGGAANGALRQKVLDYERQNLARTNPDYRNLVNEYRDGILLYEVSNNKVWDRAAKDTEGLEKFFKANKGNYKWAAPKFKSYIFFATSDSILTLAQAYADSLSTADPAAFTADMRKRFGRDVKVERVIAAKGENEITDYLGFGAPKPESDKKSRWASYGAWRGRIIDAPEEAADVKGAAVTDYQAKLEKDWLRQLHKKYKVKVDKKVLEALKAGTAAK